MSFPRLTAPALPTRFSCRMECSRSEMRNGSMRATLMHRAGDVRIENLPEAILKLARRPKPRETRMLSCSPGPMSIPGSESEKPKMSTSRRTRQQADARQRRACVPTSKRVWSELGLACHNGDMTVA
jgi:hypothetical protein